MKLKLTSWLSVLLAGLLQLLPLLRSMLPAVEEAFGSPAGSLAMKWVAGGIAVFGYHAISSASSIAISPGTATLGTPYAGTITYSGTHSASVSAMAMSNSCLGSFTLGPGLTISYSSGHTASVTGTPTGSPQTLPFTVKVFDVGGCSGLNDTRSTSLTIQNPPVTNFPPNITVAPQATVAQIGADITLGGTATGNPTPQYYWKQGISFIPGATNNTITIPAAQLTNAGIYSLVASNSQGQANSACFVTMALTPGSNILAYRFTNYIVANTAVIMFSLITNAPTAANTYSWAFNNSPIGVTTSNLSLSAAQTTPAKSGIYTINFNSTVGTSNVVVNQAYDSYWVFGYPPVVTNQPVPVTTNAGSNATFSITIAGSTYPTVFLFQNGTNLVATTNYASFNPSSATGTTNVSFTLANVSAANAGNYTFVVTNFWGSTTSAPAALTITSLLSVSALQGQTNYAGKTIALTVAPSGTAPFGFQWRNGAANVTNSGNTSGATTNTLTFSPAAVTNSGNYSVVVTNTSGSVTSSVAAVAVVAVPPFSILKNASNAIISATGAIPNSPYILQASTNLANTNGWIPLATNLASTNGTISVTDTNNPPSLGSLFYRVLFP